MDTYRAVKRELIDELTALRKKTWNLKLAYGQKARPAKTAELPGTPVLIQVDGESDRIALMKDITREKMLEAELARLDRIDLVGRMAAGIGHEIRNPLTVVRGFLQLLGSKDEYQPDSPFFELMLEELDRANTIITEYMSLATGKRVELRPQSVNPILAALLPVIESEAGSEEIEVELELDDDISLVMLDDSEFRQLLLNMARNGLEAMTAGGKLSISTRQEAGEVIVSVADQGGGLAPEIIENLGIPFVTTKDEGIGLGLAACYSIAARLRACIAYDTGVSGTTFHIRFPATCIQPQEQAENNGGGGGVDHPQSGAQDQAPAGKGAGEVDAPR